MYPIVFGQLRISNKAGEIPALSVLRTGEVAYNAVDGIIYLKRVVGGIDTVVAFASAQDILEEIVSALGGVSLESKQLPDGHGVRIMSQAGAIVDPATEATLALLPTIISSLQELTARLSTLAAAMNSGAPALRVIPIGSVSTAVTGTLAVSSIANFGTGIPAKETVDDMNNMVVTLANIQNVTA